MVIWISFLEIFEGVSIFEITFKFSFRNLGIGKDFISLFAADGLITNAISTYSLAVPSSNGASDENISIHFE